MRILNKLKGPSQALLFLMIIFACSSMPEINITYRIPEKSDDLKGIKVLLVFKDARRTEDILGIGAREEYKYFSGNISFSLARGKEQGFKIGIYDVPVLFMEGFKRGLENRGVKVVSAKRAGQIELLIVLNEFFLDLIDKKWVVTMEYEARLLKEGKVLAKQLINGRAERAKIIGRGQVDTVMGEIFTDMVNKMDLSRLYKQAGVHGPVTGK